MSCLICAEKVNGSSRKITKCEFCDFEACLSCCKIFILGEPIAKCMGPDCNKEWTRKFITNTCGQTFVNKQLKGHREQLLYDRERALLPATQPVVERLQVLEELRAEVKAIDAERQRLVLRKRDVLQKISYISESQPVERVLFTKACPSSDCRGYLNTQWKCGLCHVWACPDCHEVKGDTRDAEHVCNPDTLATTKLLASDTKNCPKCQASIHKIDGCDQMWCTLCHTAFSWKTGKTETVIHNPHYYEFLRKQSPTGEIPRNPCPQDLNNYTFSRIRNKASECIVHENIVEDLNKISRIIRNTLHITHSELTGRYKEIDYVAANQDLRVGFMQGKITEEKFKVLLQRSEKSSQKRQEIRDIFLMIQTTATDIIIRLEAGIAPGANMEELITTSIVEISSIADYANEQLGEVRKTYKTLDIFIDHNLKVDHKKEKAVKA